MLLLAESPLPETSEPSCSNAASPEHDWARTPFIEGYFGAERQEILGWFNRYAPSLGELYAGAVRLVFDYRLPGRIRFICHAVREIGNRLPDIVSGETGPSSVQHEERLNKLVKMRDVQRVSDLTVPKGEQPPVGGPGRVLVPRQFFIQLMQLLADHELARNGARKRATRLFMSLSPPSHNVPEIIGPAIADWLRVINWFMKKAHDSGVPDGECDEADLLDHFVRFEQFLMGLIRPFYATSEVLHAILEDANTRPS